MYTYLIENMYFIISSKIYLLNKNSILHQLTINRPKTKLFEIYYQFQLTFHNIDFEGMNNKLISHKQLILCVVILLVFYKLLECCWINWNVQIFYTISALQWHTKEGFRIHLLIPNHTFLVCFSSISGEFSWAIVRSLAQLCLAKIPMARPNKPDRMPKHTKKVWLGIYHTQIQPGEHDVLAKSGQWIGITGHQDSIHGFWLAN